MRRTFVLIVLDGWGLGRADESNPIHVVSPQTFAWLKDNYPMTSLQASGISVGLPWGEVGNSEVGHLTIGAGRVLYQHYPRISISIRDKTFFENIALKNAFVHARTHGGVVNFLGLLSKGNVHASIEHIKALIEFAKKENVPYALHLFSDGKDSPPHTLQEFLSEIPLDCLATLMGRHYAMDRNGHWQLTERAYETLLGKSGETAFLADLPIIIKNHYATGANEEFLPPLRIDGKKGISDGDAVVFFNYREDSIRQISEAFILKDFKEFPVFAFQNLYITIFTKYESRFEVPVVYPPEYITNPLGKVLSVAQKTQYRVAETYKYAHVTYFFNGYREPPYDGEYRALIPSLNIPHIDEHPEMRAREITDRVIQIIQDESFSFVLVNYANPDSIAHTGNYDAAIEAVRTIDVEIGRLIQAANTSNTTIIITSDHGNVEELINPMTARPETQHDPNPVPFYLIDEAFRGKKFVNQQNLNETAGILSDIAPTILELMELPLPQEMTGKSLLRQLLD